MALFIEGMECRICKKEMYRKDGIILFPAFVSNKKDPLYFFSDCSFHKHCFNNHPLAETVNNIMKIWFEKLKPGNYQCDICNKEIVCHTDYYGIGYLTSDEKNPLNDYLFFQCHKTCLPNWKDKEKVIRLLEDYNKTGNWEGDGLTMAIDELKELAKI